MPIKGSKLSSFDCVSDLHHILRRFKKEYKKASIYILGVSMGASQFQKYLQVYGPEVNARAACTIGSFWNAVKASEHLESNFLANKFLTFSMQEFIQVHMHEPHYLKLLKEKGIDGGKKIAL